LRGLEVPRQSFSRQRGKSKARLGRLTYTRSIRRLLPARVFPGAGYSGRAFVQLGWDEFMTLLGDRVASRTGSIISACVCTTEVATEAFAIAECRSRNRTLRGMGLVEMWEGSCLAWLSLDEFYAAHTERDAPLLAHRVIAASRRAPAAEAEEVIIRSEVIEFPSGSGLPSPARWWLAAAASAVGWQWKPIRRRRAAIPATRPRSRVLR